MWYLLIMWCLPTICSGCDVDTLQVIVHKAKVKSSDWFGTKSDPNAKVVVGSSTKNTGSKSNTDKPKWESTLTYTCISADSNIHVKVTDSDTWNADDTLLYADWFDWTEVAADTPFYRRLYNRNKDKAEYYVDVTILHSGLNEPSIQPSSSTTNAPSMRPTSSTTNDPSTFPTIPLTPTEKPSAYLDSYDASEMPTSLPLVMPSLTPTIAPTSSAGNSGAAKVANSSNNDDILNEAQNDAIDRANVSSSGSSGGGVKTKMTSTMTSALIFVIFVPLALLCAFACFSFAWCNKQQPISTIMDENAHSTKILATKEEVNPLARSSSSVDGNIDQEASIELPMQRSREVFFRTSDKELVGAGMGQQLFRHQQVEPLVVPSVPVPLSDDESPPAPSSLANSDEPPIDPLPDEEPPKVSSPIAHYDELTFDPRPLPGEEPFPVPSPIVHSDEPPIEARIEPRPE